MLKKALIVVALAVFAVASIQPASFAAEQKTAVKAMPGSAQAAMPIAKPNFSMIAGTVVSIDNADPNNVKLQVKNEKDGAIHNIVVMPSTNITKVTDVSELKAGEPIRLMTRKADDKEMAMGIMFGKVKNIPAPPALKKPTAPVTSAATAKK